MNSKELLTLMRGACDTMLATVEKKNADYTATAADALANFKACEFLGLCTAETGAMVRRLDKFMREISFIKKGADGLKVKDESVKDTLLDDAAYALLLYAIIEDRKRNDVHERDGNRSGGKKVRGAPRARKSIA